jgi:hypothetical protein
MSAQFNCQTRYAALPLLMRMTRLTVEQEPPTMGDMAAMVGTSRRNLMRWSVEGIPELSADRVAVSLGLHPAELWPEWWANCPQVTK